MEDILQNLKQLEKTGEEKESGSLLLRTKLSMNGELFQGPHSLTTLCSFSASHKGMILFLQVRDLTPVRQGRFKEECSVKASIENPAMPAPASRKEQGTPHPDTAQIQHYATVATLVQSLKEVMLQARN